MRPVRDVITVGDNSGSMIFLTCRRSGCKRNSSLVGAGSLATGGVGMAGGWRVELPLDQPVA